jgi:Na+/proline symporter
MRRAAWITTLSLGVGTWLVCLLNLTTLASLLHFTGAFVASTIWPIAAGLYWRRTNKAGATLAMLLGSAGGLTAYFVIGFYVAALVGAAVSMIVVLTTTLLSPDSFAWEALSERAHGARPEATSDRPKRGWIPRTSEATG